MIRDQLFSCFLVIIKQFNNQIRRCGVILVILIHVEDSEHVENFNFVSVSKFVSIA